MTKPKQADVPRISSYFLLLLWVSLLVNPSEAKKNRSEQSDDSCTQRPNFVINDHFTMAYILTGGPIILGGVPITGATDAAAKTLTAMDEITLGASGAAGAIGAAGVAGTIGATHAATTKNHPISPRRVTSGFLEFFKSEAQRELCGVSPIKPDHLAP